MSVSGNNLSSLKSSPEVISDSLVAKIISDGSLHLGEPVQNLLVSKTVKWTSETVETSGKGNHRGAESTANQVSGVGTDVTTLVIRVDGQVQSHQLNEVVVVCETELVGKVETVILVLLDGSNLSSLEYVLVDAGGDSWELGDQVHRILECVTPVLGLLHSLSVCLGESRFVLKSVDCNGELRHWVEGVWASVDKFLNELWDFGAGSPVGGEIANLLLGWDFTSQEEPEKTCKLNQHNCAIEGLSTITFWQRLLSTWGFWEKLLALWDCLSSESDTLLRIEN